MDKRVIFAVAGSGKTSYIIDNLSLDKKSLIITYTINNFYNIKKKILQKFNGEFPSNISVMTYFNFLYSFCYKPFLADKVRAKGITYESNELISIKKSDLKYYLTSSGYFFSNRLALSFEYFDIIDDIKKRIEKYFDELLIDEIQDISGRDFNFLLKIMESQVNILFVGDFFQHTYDTSRDGNVNKNLFKDYNSYKDKFVSNGFIVDDNTFDKSWRCNNKTCKFIRDNLDIEIYSHHISDDNSRFQYIDKESEIKEIFNDENIIKLHYSNSKKYGYTHENWGDVKGEDCYKDICIILNEKTEKLLLDNSLDKLPAFTKNKLYVALTRARNNTFLISYKNLKYIKK
ncbi:UvrD-helicase domain-containing protein [Anaerococcus sp.]|uniref:UvrD-helicase domain-containing protein n=1 Tax=Anaerococcus sp. TaxID=1872515 RepID=UPI00257C2BA9|nr:UvrD-helicase domain-containing protein [Anaerococcus sp.]MBS6105469.1 AAA family ATPase [Anaerococcus sp.]